jgi:beta-phosphoglucomutase
MRDMYGGKIAREKLSHIFSHLKSTGRYERVRELTTMNDKKTQPQPAEPLIRGFVFDLDGVIVDTAVHHFDAWRRIMRELGAEIRDEDDRHTRGASRMESFNYLLDTYGVVLSESDKLVWADRKNALYLESIANITPRDLLPGADEFLRRSHAAGLRLALGSASKNARSVLDRLGVADRFDAIVDGNDVTHSKPDPEVFLKACIALGLPPDSVVVFEDAAKGLQAAIAAGCHTVGIGEPDILGDADIVVPGLHATTPDDILERIV